MLRESSWAFFPPKTPILTYKVQSNWRSHIEAQSVIWVRIFQSLKMHERKVHHETRDIVYILETFVMLWSLILFLNCGVLISQRDFDGSVTMAFNNRKNKLNKDILSHMNEKSNKLCTQSPRMQCNYKTHSRLWQLKALLDYLRTYKMMSLKVLAGKMLICLSRVYRWRCQRSGHTNGLKHRCTAHWT